MNTQVGYVPVLCVTQSVLGFYDQYSRDKAIGLQDTRQIVCILGGVL